MRKDCLSSCLVGKNKTYANATADRSQDDTEVVLDAVIGDEGTKETT